MHSASRPLLAALAVLLLAPATHAQYAFSDLVLDGAVAPGTGTTFRQISVPASLTDTGFAFHADLDGFPTTGDDVAYVDLGAGLVKVVQAGDPAPVPGSETFANFGTPQLDGAGAAFFRATYTQGTDWADGLFRWEAGVITPVLLAGDPVPPGSTSGPLTFEQVYGFDVNAAGDIALAARAEDSTGSSYSGLYLLSGGTLGLLAYEWDTEVDLPGGPEMFNAFYNPVISDAGHVVMLAGVTSPIHDSGVFRFAPGPIVHLLLDTDTLPNGGTPSSHLMTNGQPDVNNSGEVGFLTTIVGGTSPAGIFRISDSGITPIVFSGDTAPGTSGEFDSLFPHAVIADDGSVAFAAILRNGDHSYGLFVGDGQGISPVAVIGDPAPGVGGGVFSTLPQRSLSRTASGQIGFWSRIFEGTAPAGLFRAAPPPTVPTLPSWALAGLAALLADSGRRRLPR